MPGRTPDEYEARIAQLEAELAELRERVKLSVRTPEAASDKKHSGMSTIAGMEEMLLHVGANGEIRYLNGPMAKLLGIRDRNAVLGQPLSKLPEGSQLEGTLLTTFDSALRMGSAVEVERAFEELDVARLPAGHARPQSAPVLRFLATPRKGAVELVIQDVTRERWLESTFARFVSPSVIEQMVQSSSADFMAIQRRTITMLFVDMRGFTKMAQTMDAVTLCELVNEFFTTMVACIEDQQGTVDKFVGDQVVALFGAPLPYEDHALRALVTAANMISQHAQTMDGWTARGLPRCEIGIGVATGEVVVGNMGSPRRVVYTALGHWMNVTARLCGDAAPGQILTLPATHQLALEAARAYRGQAPLPRFKFERLGPRSFKNVSEPLEVLSVRLPDGQAVPGSPPRSAAS
jgi:class 3 adenylate cyclase